MGIVHFLYLCLEAGVQDKFQFLSLYQFQLFRTAIFQQLLSLLSTLKFKSNLLVIIYLYNNCFFPLGFWGVKQCMLK